ncbi:hypothetical protein PR048_012493 [Dryococelus australis]|uniref:Tyrosine-protein phosphatase domain-containing protein n=1 Tax=Dryococelus australis TaxID=614101 RepID=A0ABQ9HQ85_9NEOP|nr:hypothetical protein PR048_012493 [Dryococelus australis]
MGELRHSEVSRQQNTPYQAAKEEATTQMSTQHNMSFASGEESPLRSHNVVPAYTSIPCKRRKITIPHRPCFTFCKYTRVRRTHRTHSIPENPESQQCRDWETPLVPSSIDENLAVTQFQYNGWPTVEGEVPEVTRGLIELVDQTQNHQETFVGAAPIAVHCKRCCWSADFLGYLLIPSTALSCWRCSTLTSITLISSQGLAVKSHSNIFTHSECYEYVKGGGDLPTADWLQRKYIPIIAERKTRTLNRLGRQLTTQGESTRVNTRRLKWAAVKKPGLNELVPRHLYYLLYQGLLQSMMMMMELVMADWNWLVWWTIYGRWYRTDQRSTINSHSTDSWLQNMGLADLYLTSVPFIRPCTMGWYSLAIWITTVGTLVRIQLEMTISPLLDDFPVVRALPFYPLGLSTGGHRMVCIRRVGDLFLTYPRYLIGDDGYDKLLLLIQATSRRDNSKRDHYFKSSGCSFLYQQVETAAVPEGAAAEGDGVDWGRIRTVSNGWWWLSTMLVVVVNNEAYGNYRWLQQELLVKAAEASGNISGSSLWWLPKTVEQ